MVSMQKLMIIGNTGKQPELRYTAGGSPILTFSVACSESRKKGDEWEEKTEWFNVKMFGDAAERVSQYLEKGAQVYVEGKLQTSTWDKDDGTKGYRTEVLADRVFTLGKREPKSETQQAQADFDDLPFS